MRNRLLATFAAAILFSTVAAAQAPRRSTAKAPSGPAPIQDLSGIWEAPALSATMGNDNYPMTPWAQAKFNANKPFRGPRIVPVAESNDPAIKCDPLGFPRNILNELRPFEFIQTSDRVLQLFQYQLARREIWTDGRSLPSKPDPRYYGYSVGKWEGDYTFVVETVGTTEDTWLDGYGHPHSDDLHIEERYRRVDHDTLELTVKLDDPKAYTETLKIPKIVLTLLPKGKLLDEQLCIPSEAADYLTLMANPAAGK